MSQQPEKHKNDQPRRRHRFDRDPVPPPGSLMSAVDGRLLDPATAIAVNGVVPRPTVYVGPRLVVSKAVNFDDALEVLRLVAEPLGWDVVPEDEDPRTAELEHGLRGIRI